MVVGGMEVITETRLDLVNFVPLFCIIMMIICLARRTESGVDWHGTAVGALEGKDFFDSSLK